MTRFISVIAAVRRIALPSVLGAVAAFAAAADASVPRPPHADLVVACYWRSQAEVERLVEANAAVNVPLGPQFEVSLYSDSWEGASYMSARTWTPLLALAHSRRTWPNKSDLVRRSLHSRLPADEVTIPIARLLVRKGVNLEARDAAGMTALAVAIESGNERLAMFLIGQGADVNTTFDGLHDGPSGVSALHLAARYPSLVREMLRRGADPTVRNSSGTTPVEYAELLEQKESQALMEEHIKAALGKDPAEFRRRPAAHDDARWKAFVEKKTRDFIDREMPESRRPKGDPGLTPAPAGR